MLRRGLPLAAELADLARNLEGIAGERIRALAAELAQLFDPSQVPASPASEAGQMFLPFAGGLPPNGEGVAGHQHILQNQQIDVGGHEAA